MFITSSSPGVGYRDQKVSLPKACGTPHWGFCGRLRIFFLVHRYQSSFSFYRSTPVPPISRERKEGRKIRRSYILILPINIQPPRHVLKITLAVITSTTAISGITSCIVRARPRCIHADGIGVRENYVGARGVFCEMEVEAVKAEGNRMVGIEGFYGGVG